ncbi:MAG: Gfo/Idh/MocA family oxidoreductase [Defluviitaleaceae bacterium]|nr:Gfo/Idh/MocA family oxidoreductase [Defluviitaleaceae bacterium]
MRIGTVGSGSIVANFISAAREVAGVTVAAVYSRTKDRADAFAAEHNVPDVYNCREKFLEADLDFIYVAAPNALHFNWAKDALLAGKNVICEKPFTSNLKEAEMLIALAKEKGLFLFEAMTVPHLPNLQLIKDKLPELGKIKIAQINFSQYSSRYDAFLQGKKPNIFNPEFSGGALMDLGCYNIGFLTELFGEPKDIKYYANKAENGIDTSGVLICEYDGFIATSVAAKDSRSNNFVQIQGEQGFIYVEAESSRCIGFTLFSGGNCEECFNVQEERNTLYFEIADFKNIFDSKDFKKRDIFLDKTLKIMELLDKARKSADIAFPADTAR